MNDIGLDDFLAIMDGQVTEGDNDTFYVDESGVRSIVAPTVKERAELHIFKERVRGRDEKTKALTDELQQSEADILREFANECSLDFPVKLDTAMDWAVNIIGMDPAEVEANYRLRKGESPKRAKSESEPIKAKPEPPTLPSKKKPGRKRSREVVLAIELLREGKATGDEDAATQAVDSISPDLKEDMKKRKIESVKRSIRDARCNPK